MAIVEDPFEKVRPKMVSGRLELISRLATFSHDELLLSPTLEAWSALEIAHHVYITDGLALEQMRAVQDADNLLVEDGEEVAPRRTRESEPPVSLEAVLSGMAARREELFEYLRSLAVKDWEHPLRHPKWGQIKFYQLVNILPQHDQIHARQLAELKEAITLSRF